MVTRVYKVETVLIVVSMIVVAGLCVNIGNALLLFGGIESHVFRNTVITLFSVLGFIILPIIMLIVFQYRYTLPKFDIKHFVILSFIVVVFSHYILKSNEVYHAFIISTGEEILFRSTIYCILKSCFEKRQAIYIGSFLFAIILHLNGDLGINLAIKFPSSIILYLLADRLGLEYAISTHWLYNIIVGSIF